MSVRVSVQTWPCARVSVYVGVCESDAYRQCVPVPVCLCINLSSCQRVGVSVSVRQRAGVSVSVRGGWSASVSGESGVSVCMCVSGCKDQEICGAVCPCASASVCHWAIASVTDTT